MRARANLHIVKEDRGEDTPPPSAGGAHRYRAWCGEQFTADTWKATATDGWRVCRKCNAAYYADAAQAAGFRLGKNLTDEEKEALGQRWAWRYLIPVTDDAGREWGWCALPGGWGERWEFVTWSAYGVDRAQDDLTGSIGGHLTNGSGGALKFSSKEAILAKLPEWVANGTVADRVSKITAAAQARAEAKERSRLRDIEHAQAEAERERRNAEAAALKRENLEGLQSIRDNLGAALSNHEMSALQAAILAFGGAPPEPRL